MTAAGESPEAGSASGAAAMQTPTRKRYLLENMAAYDRKARRLCVDCKVDVDEVHEYFMVRDAVWQAARMLPHGGQLCVSCLEARLGRPLVPKDFLNLRAQAGRTNLPPRLRERMGLPPAPPPPPAPARAPRRVEVGDSVKVIECSGEMGESFWCTVLKREGDEFWLEVNNDLIFSELKFGDVILAGLRNLMGDVL